MERAYALPAPAKLNLFLHVVGRRSDGYHELQTVFALIDLADSVDVELRANGDLLRHGDLTGEIDSDLALRAAMALKRETACTLGADISVSKRIPVGSGLGGGSSDAATVLIALNRIWRLDLPRTHLQSIALRLGADVPFFLQGCNAFAEGVGERLTNVDLPLRTYAVIWPQVHVPTKEIFTDSGLTRNRKPLKMSDFSAAAFASTSAIRRDSSANSKAGVNSELGSEPAQHLFGVNDLEAVARRRVPEIDLALRILERHGQARMTGSGSAVFMPADSEAHARGAIAGLPAGWQGWTAQGLSEHPLAAWLPDESGRQRA